MVQPIKFRCENCGKEIIVTQLTTGEEGQCKHCLARVIIPQQTIPVTMEQYEEYSNKTRPQSHSKSATAYWKDPLEVSAQINDLNRRIKPWLGRIWAICLPFFYIGTRTEHGWPNYFPFDLGSYVSRLYIIGGLLSIPFVILVIYYDIKSKSLLKGVDRNKVDLIGQRLDPYLFIVIGIIVIHEIYIILFTDLSTIVTGIGIRF